MRGAQRGGCAATTTVVWSYRRTGKFAFHALTGALGADPRTAAAPIVFANGVDAIADAIGVALAAGAPRVLVGWSFYSPDAAATAAELRAVRSRCADPRVVHAAGGVHASAEPEATLRSGFDLVAVGEGERLVADLVAALDAGGDPQSLPGVAALVDGRLRRNARGERIELDDFPPFGPAHGRFGPIEITRGCIYACRFCQTPYFAGARFRHRSAANVQHWVDFLVGRGFRDFRFLSPTALSYGAAGPEPELGAVEALLAGVRAAIGPRRRLWFGTFPSEVRPEHVTAASLRLLRRYVDNRVLILGGQSGSDRLLASSARGHDAAAVERAAALCIEAGFVPHVDFLFGLPGEGPADVDATLLLMDRLVERGAKVHGHTFMPLPGTPFRRAPAAALAPELRQRLRQMASRGQLYGQWERQEGISAQLLAPPPA